MECNEQLNSLCNFEVVDEWSDTNVQNNGEDEASNPGGNISQPRKPTEGEIDEFLENVKELASCGTSGFKDVLKFNQGSELICSISSECKQNPAGDVSSQSFSTNIKNTNASIHTSRSTVSYKPGGTLMKTIFNESLNVNAISDSSLQNEGVFTSDSFSSQIVKNFEISQNTFVDLREKLKKSHNSGGKNTFKIDYNENNFAVSTNNNLRSISPRVTDFRSNISAGRDLYEQKEDNWKENELRKCEQRKTSRSQSIRQVRSIERSSRSKEKDGSPSRIRERISHDEPFPSRRRAHESVNRSRSKGRERINRSRSGGRLDISRSRSRGRLRSSRSRSRAGFRSSRSRSRGHGRNSRSRSGGLRSNSRSRSGGLRSNSRSRSRVIRRNSRDSRGPRRSRSRSLGRRSRGCGKSSRSRSRGHGRSSRSRCRGRGRNSRSRSRGRGRSSRSRSRGRGRSKTSSITGRSSYRRSRERTKSSRSPSIKSFISLSPSPISDFSMLLGPDITIEEALSQWVRFPPWRAQFS